MSLGDLDELILTCRNEEGRGYIAEAVACYRAGAYRACIAIDVDRSGVRSAFENTRTRAVG